MVLRDEVPEAVRAFQGIGGVLQFVFFDDADGTDGTARDAIGRAVERVCGPWQDGSRFAVDHACLPRLVRRPLTRDAFLGDWVDPASGALLKLGRWTLSDGRTRVNPSYRDLQALARKGVTVHGGGCAIPELWEGGQFGYAFSDPPYALRAEPGRVAALFDAVRDLLLPPRRTCAIGDWAGPELPALCPDYFEPGTEWWGVFLFTVHVAEERRLTVILGSSTD